MLRSVAISRGAFPVRTWERSSSTLTSLTQWSRFAMPQCPWAHAARWLVARLGGSAEVIRSMTSTLFFPARATVRRNCAIRVAPANPTRAGQPRP